MPLVDNIKIKIPRDEVLRMLKHDKKTELNQKIQDLIDAMIAEGKKMAYPKAIYRNFWIKGSRERAIILEGANYDLLGKNVTHHLWNSEGVSLFVATIGTEIEKRIEEFTKKASMSSAAILDAVGSAAVEGAVEYVNELINKEARNAGYKTVKRFSPGYGDWALKEQKGLLKLLDASKIGVTLSSGNQMLPQKSVSGVIGWIR